MNVFSNGVADLQLLGDPTLVHSEYCESVSSHLGMSLKFTNFTG